VAATGRFINGIPAAGTWRYFTVTGGEVSIDSVYSYVNSPPHYPEGEEAMYSYVKRYLKTRTASENTQSKEMIILSFVVTANGTLKDFRTEQSYSPELADALITAMRQMPFWAPGYLNNNPVNVKVVVPFRINRL
jgi:hypothetical protein